MWWGTKEHTEAGMAECTLDSWCMAFTEEWDLPVSGAQGGSPNIEDEW